jgi:hypothetical protein
VKRPTSWKQNSCGDAAENQFLQVGINFHSQPTLEFCLVVALGKNVGSAGNAPAKVDTTEAAQASV